MDQIEKTHITMKSLNLKELDKHINQLGEKRIDNSAHLPLQREDKSYQQY